MNAVPLVIGLIFSPLAALGAFLITYEERSHHYTDRKRPLIQALELAMATLLFFAAISLVISLIIPG